MSRPATFEEVATVSSDACRERLGEGRAVRISFIAFRGDEPKQVDLDLTYAGARDLVCSLVEVVGAIPEFRTMTVFKGVLDALSEFDEGMYGVNIPVPSDS
jgi:hypothetical protein